jgi:signal transduction histidine kinase
LNDRRCVRFHPFLHAVKARPGSADIGDVELERGGIVARSDVARARKRVWGITFIIVAALVAMVAYLAAGSASVSAPDFLPSRASLTFGLIATALAFALYVIDAERKSARLTEELIAEHAERLLLAEQESDQRDFISLTAHELRTPLTVIKGYVATLAARMDAIDPERRARYLSIVDTQTDRLSALVDGLMEVSRIESGRLSLVREPIDLPALVEDLAVTNARRWEARVRIDTRGVPPIAGDQRRIESIVTNLVDNAVKYSDDDVIVRLESADGDACISVVDHGRGIPADQMDHLFQKFSRLPDAIEADVPGTGLGLYIVRGLAEAHGGKVSVESTPGDGTTFTVRLPAARALSLPA